MTRNASQPSPADSVEGARVEQAWAEIETGYRRLIELIAALNPQDRNECFARFQRLSRKIEAPWLLPFNADTIAHFVGEGAKYGQKTREEVARVKDHYTVKPRMTARDDEIVRLRDQEKLDWDEIRKRIRGNPEWANGRDGKPVSKKALLAAYARRKKSADG